MYLAKGIETYLMYGTFTGHTQEIFDIKLTDKGHKHISLKEIDSPYTICLVWNIDVKGNAFFWVQEFEKLRNLYFKDQSFTFFLLASSLEGYHHKDEPFELHAKELFRTPVLKIENNEYFWKKVKAFPEMEIVCIFKKDTLIHKSSILDASQFIKTLQ